MDIIFIVFVIWIISKLVEPIKRKNDVDLVCPYCGAELVAKIKKRTKMITDCPTCHQPITYWFK